MKIRLNAKEKNRQTNETLFFMEFLGQDNKFIITFDPFGQRTNYHLDGSLIKDTLANATINSIVFPLYIWDAGNDEVIIFGE